MPGQLYNNPAIEFVCAKAFTYNGVDYKMGEDFPQGEAYNIETLVRARFVVPVVDDESDKPRAFHREVKPRSFVMHKLGLIKNPNVKMLTGSSYYNKPRQLVVNQSRTTAVGEGIDHSEDIWKIADEQIKTERVLREENDEERQEVTVTPDIPEEFGEQTETLDRVNPGKPHEQTPEELRAERVVNEEDLYNPTDKGVPEVLEYLTSDISPAEFQRVLAVERENKNRKGILNHV